MRQTVGITIGEDRSWEPLTLGIRLADCAGLEYIPDPDDEPEGEGTAS